MAESFRDTFAIFRDMDSREPPPQKKPRFRWLIEDLRYSTPLWKAAPILLCSTSLTSDPWLPQDTFFFYWLDIFSFWDHSPGKAGHGCVVMKVTVDQQLGKRADWKTWTRLSPSCWRSVWTMNGVFTLSTCLRTTACGISITTLLFVRRNSSAKVSNVSKVFNLYIHLH